MLRQSDGSPTSPFTCSPLSVHTCRSCLDIMLASTLLLALASVASASPLTHSLTGRNNDGAPVVDLGRAGKYRGIVQNNGTVEVNKRLCDHIQLLIRFYSLGKAFHTLKLVSSVLHRLATILMSALASCWPITLQRS